MADRIDTTLADSGAEGTAPAAPASTSSTTDADSNVSRDTGAESGSTGNLQAGNGDGDGEATTVAADANAELALRSPPPVFAMLPELLLVVAAVVLLVVDRVIPRREHSNQLTYLALLALAGVLVGLRFSIPADGDAWTLFGNTASARQHAQPLFDKYDRNGDEVVVPHEVLIALEHEDAPQTAPAGDGAPGDGAAGDVTAPNGGLNGTALTPRQQAAIDAWATHDRNADGRVTLADFVAYAPGLVVIDTHGTYFKLLLVLVVGVAIYLGGIARDVTRLRQGGYYFLMLLGTMGLFVLTSATHLLVAIVALELVAFSHHGLVTYRRGDTRASEAGDVVPGALRQFVLHAVATLTMLLGALLVYTQTGTLYLGELSRLADTVAVASPLTDGVGAQAVPAAPDSLLILALVLVVGGLAVKLGIAPLHAWSPAEIGRASYPLAVFLSVATLTAGVAMLLRFVAAVSAVPGANTALAITVTAMTALAFVAGGIGVLRERDLRRLLGSFALLGFGFVLASIAGWLVQRAGDAPGSAAVSDSLTAAGFNAWVIALALCGAFAVALLVYERTAKPTLAGFSRMSATLPGYAIGMLVCLASLIGLPATAGFVGRLREGESLLQVASRALEQPDAGVYAALAIALVVLSALAALATIVGALRIVLPMFLGRDESAARRVGSPAGLVIVGLISVALIALGVTTWGAELWEYAKLSLGSLLLGAGGGA